MILMLHPAPSPQLQSSKPNADICPVVQQTQIACASGAVKQEEQELVDLEIATPDREGWCGHDVKPQTDDAGISDLLDLRHLISVPRHASISLLELRRHAKYVKQRAAYAILVFVCLVRPYLPEESVFVLHVLHTRQQSDFLSAQGIDRGILWPEDVIRISAGCRLGIKFYDLRELPNLALTELAELDPVRRTRDGHLYGDALQHVALVHVPYSGHALRVTIHLSQDSARLISAIDRFHPLKDSRTDPSCEHHPLHSVLILLLRENTELKAMKEQLVCRTQPLNLGNVLNEIEAAADLPEVAQPQGFAKGIKLHKYQRQTLKWMCDAEDIRLRDKLWICLNRKVRSFRAEQIVFFQHFRSQGMLQPACLIACNHVQDGLYYSPMMQKLCVGVPPGSRGGFLAEEMGLGKTVRHHCLLQRPAKQAVLSMLPCVSDMCQSDTCYCCLRVRIQPLCRT